MYVSMSSGISPKSKNSSKAVKDLAEHGEGKEVIIMEATSLLSKKRR